MKPFKRFIYCMISMALGMMLTSTSQSTISPRFTSDGNAILYRIQVNTFTDDSSAQALSQQLQSQGYSATIVSSSTCESVKIGNYSSFNSANIALILVRAQGYYNASVMEETLSPSNATALGISYQPSYYEQATANINPTSVSSENQLIQQANLTFSTGSTTSTIKNLAQLIVTKPQSSYIATAKYQLGTIYYGRYFSRYSKNTNIDEQWEYLRAATQVFQDVITNYANDTVAPLAQFQLAYCKNALRRFGSNSDQKLADSVNQYQTALSAVSNTGDTTLMARTQMMLASYIFEQALNNTVSWDSVRAQLALVGSNYPSSASWIQARTQVMNAETYYYQKNYDQASSLVNNLLNKYSTCTLECNMAKYLEVKIQADNKDYAGALQEYTNLYNACYNQTGEIYPDLTKGIMFGQAWCNKKLGQDSTAQQVAIQLMSQYPNSSEANKARIIFWQRYADPYDAPLMVGGQPIYLHGTGSTGNGTVTESLSP